MEQKSIIHLILTVAPAVSIIFILFQIIFTEHGIFESKSLKIQHQQTLNDIKIVKEQNRLIRNKIEGYNHPKKKNQVVAEGLLLGLPESTVYRFQGQK